MTDKTPAEFPLSILEYKVFLAEPVFGAFERPTVIADSIYRAFRDWNPTFENITFRTLISSANDFQVGCDFAEKRVSFIIKVQSCTLTVTNPSWAETELIRHLMEQGIAAMGESTKGIPKSQTATLALHVTGAGKSRLERMEKFRPAVNLPGKKDAGFAFCIYGENSSWLVDLSAVYGDALFVKIERTFDASISIADVAASLYKDEQEILDLLELSLV